VVNGDRLRLMCGSPKLVLGNLVLGLLSWVWECWGQKVGGVKSQNLGLEFTGVFNRLWTFSKGGFLETSYIIPYNMWCPLIYEWGSKTS